MKKKLLIIFIFVILFGGCIYIYGNHSGDEDLNIIKYQVMTHEYYDDIQSNKYIIRNKDDYNNFCKIYSDCVKIDEKYFGDNFVFVQLEQMNTSSVGIKLKDVSFEDGKLEFILDREKAKDSSVTEDMALWYLVAVVPKSKLGRVDFSDFKKPTDYQDVFINNINRYEITTDLKYKTMRDDGGSYNSVYYQVDLESGLVKKIKEVYKANIMSKSSLSRNIIYQKNISDDLIKDFNYLITDLIDEEDVKTEDTCFTIKGFKINKDIYNGESIDKISDILKKIDDYS